MTLKQSFFWILITLLSFSCVNDAELLNEKNESEHGLEKDKIKTPLEAKSASSVDLLWDIGLNKRSIIHRNGLEQSYYSVPSDLSEADIVGNPPSNQVYTTEIGDYHSPNKTIASVTFYSYNYPGNTYGQFPGYDLWFTGGWGQPAYYKFKNNSRQFNTYDLREVGLVTNHDAILTHGIGKWSFKQEFRLSDFDEIKGKFNSKLEIFREPKDSIIILDNVLNRSYLTVDFRITYVDTLSNGWQYEKLRTDVLGIIFCNISDSDMNPEHGIFYKEFNITQNTGSAVKNIVLLDAKELGLDYLNNQKQLINGVLDYEEKYLEFDFKPLIAQYFPPPPEEMGIPLDPVIVGFDIYSATTGGDITFNVNDITLKGIKY